VRGALIILLLLVAGCHTPISLSAPKAMLSDVLFVDLDVIVEAHEVMEIGGSVANLTDDMIWIDPMHWRLAVNGVETKPVSPASVHEVPGFGVAYVRLTFAKAPRSNSQEDPCMLVVGGVSGHGGPFPLVLGAIPLTRGAQPSDAGAAALPRVFSRAAAKQPSGEELLERGCGSGPLVTCPR
jgi:hypothetical protein